MRSVELEDYDHGANVIAPEISLSSDSFGAYVVAAPVNRAGSHVLVATGDGKAAVLPLGSGAPAANMSLSFGGAVPVAAAPAGDPLGFVLGLDDGSLRFIGIDGDCVTIRESGGQWVDNVVSAPHAGLIACSAGRTVDVYSAAGVAIASFSDHPSTPAGLSFSPDGARLAVARYNGVTIWDISSGEQVKDLFWRGSHTAVSWSPDGTFIVTATQDRDLHCWRVSDGKDYRMSGYPSKIRSLSWTNDSRYVCASGADTVTAWYCGHGGPAGKPPIELGYVFNGVVTQVACHPDAKLVAAGYDDGTVMIGDLGNGEAMISKTAGGGMVTSLAWAAGGASVVSGSAEGVVSTMTVTISPPPAAVH